MRVEVAVLCVSLPKGSRRDQEEVQLDPQVSPEEIMSREVELDPQPRRDYEQGGGAGPSS